MKTIIILFLSMILSGITFGQFENEKMKHIDVDEVQIVPPKFILVKNSTSLMKEGNFESIEDYLVRNIEYPLNDVNQLNQGIEIVQFIVSSTGELSDFKIVNGISTRINEEVIKSLKTTSGMWIPGYNNKERVAMKKEISIAFTIPGSRYYKNFETTARKYFRKGNKALRANNLEKTLKCYNKGIMLSPKDKSLLFMRGLVKYELGDENAAYIDWDRIIALDSSSNPYEYYSEINDFKECVHFIQ